ncbi:MAG: CAAX prenyl protease-related protein [Thermodesulfobacteriota bacterium]|nr:CAAX prenyl protease-related protein [Thermodesulfobacteriota bacterium]
MPVPRKPPETLHEEEGLSLLRRSWAPYVVPFVLFLGLTVPVTWFPGLAHLLYIAKTLLVGGVMWAWRRRYAADFLPGLSWTEYIVATAAGLAVLPVWILPETILPQLGTATGFNPYAFGYPPLAVPAVIGVRLLGAALVVPIMEELFWRSFLQRYLVNPDFQKVSLGAFTWFSFLAVVVLFGLEHNRWIQGIFAGVVYGFLVIRQKSIRGCVIAHVVTNLGLGLYVITTGSWYFW